MKTTRCPTTKPARVRQGHGAQIGARDTASAGRYQRPTTKEQLHWRVGPLGFRAGMTRPPHRESVSHGPGRGATFATEATAT
jgi:hypothetical protein